MPERPFVWFSPRAAWGLGSPWDGVNISLGILMSLSLGVGGSVSLGLGGPNTLQSCTRRTELDGPYL